MKIRTLISFIVVIPIPIIGCVEEHEYSVSKAEPCKIDTAFQHEFELQMDQLWLFHGQLVMDTSYWRRAIALENLFDSLWRQGRIDSRDSLEDAHPEIWNAGYGTNCISYFEDLTGTESQIYKGGCFDTFDYDEKEDYLTDRQVWMDWYDENKCWITKVRADSIRLREQSKHKVYFSLKEALANHDLVYRLNLDKQGLNEVPQSIGELRNLRSLSLARNRVTNLPELLGNLPNLKYLNLFGNKLTEDEITRTKLLLPDCKIVFKHQINGIEDDW